MAIFNQTFSEMVATTTSIAAFDDANAKLDAKVNGYLNEKHWSCVRDIYTTVLTLPNNVVIMRTLVLSTEVLAQGTPTLPTTMGKVPSQRQ